MPAMSAATAVPPLSLSSPLAARVWRGSDLGRADTPVQPSGWAGLDAELPGGGWPCGSLNEILSPQAPLLEWRLLGPALRQAQRAGASLVVVGPPAEPYLPGLQGLGLEPERLVWVRTREVAQSLWTAEQVLRAGTSAALLVWLPTCRAEALRRLHAHAQGGRGLLFVLRPESAGGEASAAPLRVQARAGLPGQLWVRLRKRRGPAHEHELCLPAWPGGLEQALPAAAPVAAAGPAQRGGRGTRLPLGPRGEERHAVGRVTGLRLA